VIVWIDAQISPQLASWFRDTFQIDATAVRDLQLRDASDQRIFLAARAADAVVLTKDADFVKLLEQHGPPPRIVWLTCGNTSNAALVELLQRRWSVAQQMLDSGEPLVEIGGVLL
jgi:predicted nuclease of predicted toxin-antitoxin system